MGSIEVYSIPGFQEPVNCFTHLIAAVVFFILSFSLVRRGRASWVGVISLSIMSFSSVFLLSMSAVYHLLGPGAGRDVMRQLDIAGVFVLIAGSMTPVHAILDRGVNRWGSLLLIWVTAATGITLTTIFSDSLPSIVGIGIFLLFGWGGVISFFRLWKRYGFSFVRPLLWGGVAYTLGAIALELNSLVIIPHVVHAHEVWHVAVIIGLGLHWKFAFQIAQGAPPAPSLTSNLASQTILSS